MTYRGTSHYQDENMPIGFGGRGQGRARGVHHFQSSPPFQRGRSAYLSGNWRTSITRENQSQTTSRNDSKSTERRDDTNQPTERSKNNSDQVGYSPNRRMQTQRGRDSSDWRRGRTQHSRTIPIFKVENISTLLARLNDASISEVLGMVSDPQSTLRTFLFSRDKCSHEALAQLFQLFHTVTVTETAPELSAQFIVVLTSSPFLGDTLTHFIASDFITATESIPQFNKFVENLLDVLMACYIRSQAFAHQYLSGIVLMLERQIEVLTLSQPSLITAAVKEKMCHLTNVRQVASQLTQGSSGEATQQSHWERRMIKQDATLPPDNFRHLSVFPVQSDIEMDTHNVFLRRNLVRGVYASVETYLDIQYRLMREDFVEPLRKGVKQYLEVMARAVEANNRNRRRERLDLKVYTDVRVGTSFPTHDVGVVHDLKFNVERLKHIIWEKSKRLMYGTLVCLSSDNFNTMYFGTVVLREDKDLKKGVVNVKFNRQVPPKQGVYVMAESSVFFEAYRHTLTRLKELSEDNFPMRDVLLGTFVTNKAIPLLPEYMRTDATVFYDLSPLIDKKVMKMRGGDEYGRVYPRGRNIWPHKDDLGMDDSQFEAFKNALTRDVALMQGPPGCGKTYVGLRIVQTLLGVTRRVGLGPILIVCYTNHALDQFLGGILPFCTNGIVRVGRQCKSEGLEKFSIKNLRSRRRTHFGGAVAELMAQLQRSENQIFRYQRIVEKSVKAILSLEDLGTVIPENVKSALMRTSKQPKKALTNWLLGVEDLEDTFSTDLIAICCRDVFECMLMQEIFTNAHIIFEEYRFNLDELQNDLVAPMENVEEEERDEFSEQQAVSEAKEKFKRLNKKDVMSEFEGETEWSVATSRKSLHNMIHRRLGSGEIMTEEEADRIDNIFTLTTEQRWRLYNFWRSRSLELCSRLKEDEEVEFERLVTQHQEMRQMEDMEVFQAAEVIGMTTTGAARYGRVLTDLQPRIVIVEEAAEVLESHIVTALSRGTQHLILIGDHKQLRPNNAVYRLAKDYNLDISLFERLINSKYPYDTLALQHRMRPEIAVLMNHIYDNLGNHPCVEKYEHVRGIANDVFFIHHEHQEVFGEEGSSYSNPFEAELIAGLCRYLQLNGYEASRITVLTLYSGQLFTLQRSIPKESKEKERGVRISVVDNFQGEENDIILLSLVRSNAEDKIGFLERENRICVALSRAKVGLFVIGNVEMLSRTNQLWRNIVSDMRNVNSCGNALRLVCQVHPEDEQIEVRTAEDFKKAPEGGCSKMCNERLMCGHACRRLCHPMDREHKLYECKQPCTKMCAKLLHPCTRLCYQKCGACKVRVEAVLPKCGHKQQVFCSDELNRVSCLTPCEKILAECQHVCQAKCGQRCTEKCSVLVEATLPFCGHTNMIACHLSRGDLWSVKCNKPCEETQLPCGHPCGGTCGNCCAGRLHQLCFKKVKEVLVCGHEIASACHKDRTVTCNQTCLDSCGHHECTLKCGDFCGPCCEPCLVKCEHRRCTKMCCEPCDAPPCNVPCKNRFYCKKCKRKVACVGLCGEFCPQKCRQCDQQVFGEVAGQVAARYLLLWNCKHLVEVSRMDEHVKSLIEQEVLQAITCPQCKMPVTKRCTKRYTIQINEMQRLKKLAMWKSMCPSPFVSPINLAMEWSSLKYQINNVFEYFGISYAYKYCDEQVDLLKTPRAPIVQMQRSKKLLECLKEVYRVYSYFKSSWMFMNSESDLLRQHIRRSLESFVCSVIDCRRSFGPTTVGAFQREMCRMNCLINCSNIKYKLQTSNSTKSINDVKVEIASLMQANSTLQPKMSIEDMNACLSRLETNRDGVTAKKAMMGLIKGHWVKCPQGHVYVTTDCSGANEQRRCLECEAAVSDNQRSPIDVIRQHIDSNLGNPPCVEKHEHVRGVVTDVFFVQHNHWDVSSEEKCTYSTQFETEFIIGLCRHLLLNDYSPSRITVLTMYSCQVLNIQRCMQHNHVDGVRIKSLDDFHGEENDIILFSLVRSNSEDRISFLERQYRASVALTRAKIGLFVFGDLELFNRSNQLWHNFMTDIKKTMNIFGNALRITCQIHSDDAPREIRTTKDFEKAAPDGGCSKECNKRLSCGHLCPRMCHPMDRSHMLNKCQQPCTKMCAKGLHPCPRLCHQECGPCQVRVEAVRSTCEHKQDVACSQDVNKIICPVVLEAKFPFCGHSKTTPCHSSKTDLWSVKCNKPCEETQLPCGHQCKGNCYSCAAGRLHQHCFEEVKVVLLCGHEVMTTCNEKHTIICNEKCLDSCGHYECTLPCGGECAPCDEPCIVQCEHRRCRRTCCEPCNVPPCNEPCKETFKCKKCKGKVACIGLCGEVCPEMCRLCEHQEFKAVNDQPDARYLLLPQCKHVVEVSRMDKHVQSLMKQKALQAITCPQCKKPITKRCTQRYMTQLNEMQRLRKLAYQKSMEKCNVVVPDLLALDWTSMKSKFCMQLRKLGTRDAEKYCDEQIKVVEDPETTNLQLEVSRRILECLKVINGLYSGSWTKVRFATIPLTEHMKFSLELLKNYLFSPKCGFGPIMVEAFQGETRRIACLVHCITLITTLYKTNKTVMADVKVEIDSLMQAKSGLSEEQMEACLKRLKNISKILSPPGLEFPKMESAKIVSTMGLIRGHWIKCSQGHVYLIPIGGSGNERSKCPECDLAQAIN